MARTAYDVNRTVRHLDIHKKFMGGLKTVDTDDALRTVYLRELKNLSLSEFGFIEKRYGIYKSEEFQFVNTNGFPINPFNISANAGLIQGYFEYIDKSKRVHKLIFIDGVPYIKDPRPGSAYPDKYRAVDLFYEEPENDYPSLEDIEIGTGFTGVQDNSGTISVTIPSIYDVHYLAKDLSQPEFHFTFTPDITFSAIDIQDQSSAYNITIATNFTVDAIAIGDEISAFNITIDSFVGNFFQAVSQLDIERGYAVNVSPNFDFADLGQIDISRSYSYNIQTNLTFNYEALDFQTESDAFDLTIPTIFTYQGSDNTTVNDPTVSVSTVTSNSAQLNVSNSNNPFEVIAKYSLVSSQPNLNDTGFTVAANSTDSTVITGLNSEQNYTVAVRLYRSADTSYFSDPDSASFTTCITAGTSLGYSCSGTTRINSYADGSCGTYTTTESNSTACGYVPPPPPDPTLDDPEWSEQGQQIGETAITVEVYNPNTVSATVEFDWGTTNEQLGSESKSIGAESNQSVTASSLDPDTSYNFFAKLTKSGYNDSDTISQTLTTDEETCDPDGTYLGYSCSGTTRINEYADGNCGTYTTQTSNSTACGYTPPAPDPEPDPEPEEYTVTFKDWDGTTLKTETVEEGEDATAPPNPTRSGYTFKFWDSGYQNIQSNKTINAVYEEDTDGGGGTNPGGGEGGDDDAFAPT